MTIKEWIKFEADRIARMSMVTPEENRADYLRVQIESIANCCLADGRDGSDMIHDELISVPLRVLAPIFGHGDTVRVPPRPAKSADFHLKIQKLAAYPSLVVAGTRIIKRFPVLFDHQNNEYVMIVTFDIDDEMIEIPSTYCVKFV